MWISIQLGHQGVNFENILNSFEYLLSVDAVLLLSLWHIKPLAAVWFVVVDVECVPVEATVIKLPDDAVFSCQILNGLKLKYLDSNFYFLINSHCFIKKEYFRSKW